MLKQLPCFCKLKGNVWETFGQNLPQLVSVFPVTRHCKLVVLASGTRSAGLEDVKKYKSTGSNILCVYFENMKGVECLMTRNLSPSNARWSVCSLCLSMNNAPPSPKAHPLTRISPHAARPTIVYYPNKATPCFNTKHRSNPRSVDN